MDTNPNAWAIYTAEPTQTPDIFLIKRAGPHGSQLIGTACGSVNAATIIHAMNQMDTATNGAPITREGVTIARCAPDHAGRLQAASDSYDSLSAEVLDLNAELRSVKDATAECADTCLQALRIAHSRIVRERQIVLDCEGGHDEADDMERELSVLEEALTTARAMRDEARQ